MNISATFLAELESILADSFAEKDEKTAKSALKEGIQQIEVLFPDSKPRKIKVLFNEVKNYVTLFEQIEDNKK